MFEVVKDGEIFILLLVCCKKRVCKLRSLGGIYIYRCQAGFGNYPRFVTSCKLG